MHILKPSNGRRVLNLGSSTTSLSTIANFRDSSNGVVGNVQTNAGGTSFNSISDYRLKENIVGMTNALDRVSQLKPSQYNLKNIKKILSKDLLHTNCSQFTLRQYQVKKMQ